MAKKEKAGFELKQLLLSKQFSINEKDILKAIVGEEKLTISEAKKKIENFLKRKVK
ncbi:hypothetical protein [Abyssisolibacter fermentans]|uniref:hypothetical protein n=1 Tax=Abyssisolibacter fermentans TaxID=1766203 RepID=UPI0012E3F61B|nr:hypothetical protein [Abyssisolibacter fermentans]